MTALAWIAYDLAMELVVLLVLGPYERVRSIVGRSRAEVLDERLGRSKSSIGGEQGRILIHAVSVGEMVAAKALVDAIFELDADRNIVITCGNHEGRQMAESVFRSHCRVEVLGYLPWDRRHVLRPWLQNLRLVAIVVVETEIWPGLFRIANELGTPLFIVNGRVVPGDVARYRLARRFFADVLDRTRWIAVQNEDELRRFIEIGAPSDRIDVVGNLKADGAIPDIGLPDSWENVFNDIRDPIVVAGSTHTREHDWMLWAYRKLLPEHPGLRLIIAPRHPKRAQDVAALAGRSDLEMRLWSEGPSSAWQVLVVDEIGVLAQLYGRGQVAVVGGSLVRRGGHNPLETVSPGGGAGDRTTLLGLPGTRTGSR
ncbi:MAG: hypothetical protein K8R59_16515 [Thermoanaerobaculales bacterium]|nr:hypothetical protein [Thermoanaerobaculales bacterium]